MCVARYQSEAHRIFWTPRPRANAGLAVTHQYKYGQPIPCRGVHPEYHCPQLLIFGLRDRQSSNCSAKVARCVCSRR